MRTLIVDNSVVPMFLRENILVQRRLPEKTQVVRAVWEKLPPRDSFDRLVLTGSETSILEDKRWILAEMELVRRAVSDGKPVLGICFGHQLLARALWGKDHVRRMPVPEFGWLPIDLDTSDPLFQNMPSTAKLYCSHFQEAIDPPAEIKVIASSEMCGVHGFHFVDKPVWGVQFHPEMDRLGGLLIFTYCGPLSRQARIDMKRAWHEGEDPQYADTIFRNFLQES